MHSSHLLTQAMGLAPSWWGSCLKLCSACRNRSGTCPRSISFQALSLSRDSRDEGTVKSACISATNQVRLGSQGQPVSCSSKLELPKQIVSSSALAACQCGSVQHMRQAWWWPTTPAACLAERNQARALQRQLGTAKGHVVNDA